MVAQFLLFLIFVAVLYAYTSHPTQFAATASAIQQIWSGSCRLSCQLNDDQPPQTEAQVGHPGPSCVCESCPCALVRDVQRSCSPVTKTYNSLIEYLSHYYYTGLEMLGDRYPDIFGNAETTPTFRSVHQLTSTGNFSFGNNANNANIAVDPKQATLSPQPSGLASNLARIKSKLSLRDSATKGLQQQQQQQQTSTKSTTSNIKFQDAPNSKDCSRCSTQGKTCIKNCPKAKKK